jgi:hypothetical protein
VTPIAELLARVGPGFFQQAFVVADLDAAQAAFTETIGCPRWTVLPASPLPYRYRGREVEAALALAFGRSGGVQIELIQPVNGESVHTEFLESNGPGAHHLGYFVDRVDEEVARVAASGLDTVMSGEFGSVKFVYVDTYEALGVYVELVEDPDGIIRSLTP